jgi:hypothetical protein
MHLHVSSEVPLIHLQMARATSEPYNQPWLAFAKALPEYPFVSFDILTDTEVRGLDEMM